MRADRVLNTKSQREGVSLIIPTLATLDRREQLIRAIRSAQENINANIRVIVCANGERWDLATLELIERMPNVKVHTLSESSLPKAIAYGRSVVESKYFAFLDDDDQLLPGGLDSRLAYLHANPACDLVATNGIRRTEAGDELALRNLGNVSFDPLTALFVENWLPSCGALYRTTSVGQSYFDDYHDFAEWTWLAFNLALHGKRIGVLDQRTFVVNDTIGSRSKSATYRTVYLNLFQRMIDRNPPPTIRKIIQGRMANALHDASVDSLQRGALPEATQYHFRSLQLPGGFRFASYSRQIIFAMLRRSWRRSAKSSR